MSADRYAKKPFARLLECYVLKAIGELSDEEEGRLSEMEPQLCKIYKYDGSWLQVIAYVMEFPSTMPATIEQMWRRNREIAEASGGGLKPQQFAEIFVDRNFP